MSGRVGSYPWEVHGRNGFILLEVEGKAVSLWHTMKVMIVFR